jgi:surfeit locus 1 family protein
MALSLRQRRWLTALATGLGMAITARMGVWQLDRAQQKLDLQAAMQQAGQSTPLALRDLARDTAEAATQWYRPVQLQGRWLADHTLYLDNRQMGGRPGFFVLTPLELAPGDAVMVQRGWLPRDAQDRAHLKPVLTPTGIITVSGRVAPPPSKLVALGEEGSGPIRQNVDLALESTRLGLALRPASLVELPNASNAGDGLARDWPLPALDVQKHYGYAVQWFAMCTLMAGLYLWFQLLRPRRDTSS